MRIYEIGGIDNSGKSTQIKILSKLLNDVYVPESLLAYSSRFPKDLNDRIKAYCGKGIENIIEATCEGIVNRKVDILCSDKEYALLDRGNVTLFASNVARMMGLGLKYKESSRIVEDVWQKYNINRDDHQSIILALSSDPVSNFERREGKAVTPDHARYLRNFNYCLNKLCESSPNVARIDAEQPLSSVTEDILSHMKAQSVSNIYLEDKYETVPNRTSYR